MGVERDAMRGRGSAIRLYYLNSPSSLFSPRFPVSTASLTSGCMMGEAGSCKLRKSNHGNFSEKMLDLYRVS